MLLYDILICKEFVVFIDWDLSDNLVFFLFDDFFLLMEFFINWDSLKAFLGFDFLIIVFVFVRFIRFWGLMIVDGFFF